MIKLRLLMEFRRYIDEIKNHENYLILERKELSDNCYSLSDELSMHIYNYIECQSTLNYAMDELERLYDDNNTRDRLIAFAHKLFGPLSESR